MNLKSISVLGLFDVFNHHIEFNDKENITLMLGLNGVGKTIILKMIKSFFDKNLNDFSQYHFKAIILNFNVNKKISLIKDKQDDGFLQTLTFYDGDFRELINKEKEYDINNIDLPNEKKYEMKLYDKDSRYRTYGIAEEYYFKNRIKREKYSKQLGLFDFDLNYDIIKYIPRSIEQVSSDVWVDQKEGIAYSTQDLVSRYSKYFPKEIQDRFNFPSWLQEAMDVCKVKLIETQRLLNKIESDEGKYKSAVLDFSRGLVENIKKTKAEASDLAAKLDRTFPNRLIERLEHNSKVYEYSEKETQDKLNNLNEKREFLSSVGLIDATDEHIKPIPDVVSENSRGILRSVLNVYTDDSNLKLSKYDTLARKINLLINIINKRFIYKKIKVDREKGFVFYSTFTDKEIPLSGLSSGEQHELVLFYQLLFTADQYNLLLIDEPEISLHISWQKRFIDDLREVIKVNSLNIVIATHSPDIIGNHWDLTVQMRGI